MLPRGQLVEITLALAVAAEIEREAHGAERGRRDLRPPPVPGLVAAEAVDEQQPRPGGRGAAGVEDVTGEVAAAGPDDHLAAAASGLHPAPPPGRDAGI